MTVGSVLSILWAVVKFWPSVVEFLKIIQGTPAEKHAEILARVAAASKDADATHGNTKRYEDIFSGRR